MKVRRLAAVMSGVVIVALAPSAASAAAAPPGGAQSAVAEFGDLLGVGTTSAQAGPQGTASSANAISVNGQPLLPQTGGSQTGPGTSSFGLLDTGETPIGRVQVTPWSASNRDGESEAMAAVAWAYLLGIRVSVVQSQSNASWSESASRSSASTDGATVSLPDGTSVVVLHSDADSSGEGGSYAAGINGTRLLTTDDADGACAAGMASLLQVNCLAASGGSGLASFAEATFGSSGLPNGQVGALTAAASGLEGAVTPETPAEEGTAPGAGGLLNGSSPQTLLGRAGDPAADGAALARTGASVGMFLLVGLFFMGLGGAVRAARPWAGDTSFGQRFTAV